VQYIWNIESHHWTCGQCHPVDEIEGGLQGVRLPSHPHLRTLRRVRKEMLRRQLIEEGRRVGGIRRENELLVQLLQEEDTGVV
jgi:hypothetical protein